MKRAAALLLALAGPAAGCGVASRDYVTPWFRVDTSERHVIAPHALEFGGAKSAAVQVDGRWRGLDHDGWFDAHPVTRFGKGSQIEPSVAVHEGSCYTIVARTTPDLARIALTVRHEWPDIETSFAHSQDPAIARTEGPSGALLRRCVQRGDPLRLSFVIEGRAAQGYVVARVYSEPAGSEHGSAP